MKTNTGTRGLATLLATATTLALVATPARAATNGTQPPTATQSAVTSDMQATALAQAKASGTSVPVDDLTTAQSATAANPDGSFTTTTSVFPTRMTDSSGAWVSIDPTLVRLSDGTIATTATPDTLTLSGGGTGNVATISDTNGHSLGLGLNVSLPAPTLSGANATYADVYPGVDLVVTAQPTGSFDEVFVVNSAAAAQTISQVSFTTHVSNLTLSAGAGGQVTATDPATGAVFATSPAAMMWDSSETNTQLASSTVQDPAPDALVGAMPTSLTADTLNYAVNLADLNSTTSEAPQAKSSTLRSLDTTAAAPVHYPLYLDPTWTLPAPSGADINYSETHGGGTNTDGTTCKTDIVYNSTSEDPGAGHNDGTNEVGNCLGEIRSFFTLNISNIPANATVVSSTLKASELYSSWGTCNHTTESITANWTGGISSSTDWNNQPGNAAGNTPNTQSLETLGQGSSACSGGVQGNWDMKANVSAARGASNITLDLVGNNEATGSY